MSKNPRSMSGTTDEFPYWVKDPMDPMEKKVLRWTYLTCMKQRGILFKDVANYLNVTVQRVEQLFNQMNPTAELRLDEAITFISEVRHREMGHQDDDPTCIAISLGLRHLEPGVVKAKVKLEKERHAELRREWANAPDEEV